MIFFFFYALLYVFTQPSMWLLKYYIDKEVTCLLFNESQRHYKNQIYCIAISNHKKKKKIQVTTPYKKYSQLPHYIL